MLTAGELNAVHQPVPQVIHERDSIVAVPTTNQSRNHQLRVGIQSCPRPRIAPFDGGFHCGDVLLLGGGK